MYLPLLLILAYLRVDSTHAFALKNSFLSSTNNAAGRLAALNRTPCHRDQPRTPTASMSGSSGGNTAWPPSDRLSEYVTESSLVDYDRLAAQENDWLAPVISRVKKTNPETDAERHAFLINAYNLWTLHYVIRERKSARFKGAVSTLAKARFFYWHKVSTGAGRWNLYNFENKVIRPDVNDARVHFALNCASMSCPPLRRKLFTGPGLDAELDEVTSAAINGGAMVKLNEGGKTLSINPIFKWYKGDFDKEGGVLAFIKSHWTGPHFPDNVELDFFEYDWRTNIVDAEWSQRALGGAAP